MSVTPGYTPQNSPVCDDCGYCITPQYQGHLLKFDHTWHHNTYAMCFELLHNHILELESALAESNANRDELAQSLKAMVADPVQNSIGQGNMSSGADNSSAMFDTVYKHTDTWRATTTGQAPPEGYKP